ncbi:hypothetical protein SAMN04488128_103110 [Chitinophaga eiseniae]|uniref:Uncharacterized protein n=1 Tax=Chitinophaga eiseniae TaxID=634771 RepID=A0A1T4SM67_9BACT|nr:hypothetical protein [Chitinophaga eiseniae]SKA29380.1 hypothetical protein SAMN04488128_103110 [Chitinophaga eiseniae]
MKSYIVFIIFLFPGIPPAYAQLIGYYTAESVDGSKEKAHFILEERGLFYIFIENHFVSGKWKPVNKNKISLEPGQADLVELYVSTGNNHGGQICFGGFAEKEAFVRMSPGDPGTSFRQVYREKPKCNYSIYEYIRVNRKECNDITVAIKLPPSGKDTAAYVYNFQIPEKYDEIYLQVNNNAFPRGQRNISIEYKDGHYLLGNIELQKQPNAPALPQLLETRYDQLNKDRIKAIRKELYIKNGPVEKITPQKSRQSITVGDHPVISVDCPPENAFPPVTLPPGRKQ